MLVIKVWCLPRETEEELRRLHREIAGAVIEDVPELSLKTENDMTVLFPADMMEYGLGTEVVVEVSGLSSKFAPSVRNRLAEVLGRALKAQYPGAKVMCYVTVFEPWQGFWTSEE